MLQRERFAAIQFNGAVKVAKYLMLIAFEQLEIRKRRAVEGGGKRKGEAAVIVVKRPLGQIIVPPVRGAGMANVTVSSLVARPL